VTLFPGSLSGSVRHHGCPDDSIYSPFGPKIVAPSNSSYPRLGIRINLTTIACMYFGKYIHLNPNMKSKSPSPTPGYSIIDASAPRPVGEPEKGAKDRPKKSFSDRRDRSAVLLNAGDSLRMKSHSTRLTRSTRALAGWGTGRGPTIYRVASEPSPFFQSIGVSNDCNACLLPVSWVSCGDGYSHSGFRGRAVGCAS